MEGFWPRNRPTVALLRVSEAIHLETSLVFYGRNRFRLPLYPDRCQDSAFKTHSAQIRHVTVAFDMRDVDDEEYTIMVKAVVVVEDEQNTSLISDKERFRKQYIKSEMIDALFGIRARKKKTRFPMKNLRTIVIDLRYLDMVHRPDWNLLENDSFYRDGMSYWAHPIGYDAQSTLPAVSVRVRRHGATRKLVHGKWAFPASKED